MKKDIKINKKAFTIPELLIFITIVGVISVMMLTIIKPGEKYIPYAYYNAYYVLSTAAFNINEDATDVRTTDEDGTAKAEDKVFPGIGAAANDTVSSKELCKKLALNPAGGADEDKYGYINTTQYYCNENFKTVPANPSDADLAPGSGKVAFRATNSMRFYISPLQSISVNDPLNNNSATTITYFIVWVDLNGDRHPNTAVWSEKRPADIVPFIITTAGTVLPVGNPTRDARYTTARVQYPASSKLGFSPNSRTIYDAQIAAYGGHEYPNNEPYSLGSSLRNKLKGTSAEIKNYTPTTTVADDHCKVETADEAPHCTIVIDENKKM